MARKKKVALDARGADETARPVKEANSAAPQRPLTAAEIVRAARAAAAEYAKANGSVAETRRSAKRSSNRRAKAAASAGPRETEAGSQPVAPSQSEAPPAPQPRVEVSDSSQRQTPDSKPVATQRPGSRRAARAARAAAGDAAVGGTGAGNAAVANAAAGSGVDALMIEAMLAPNVVPPVQRADAVLEFMQVTNPQAQAASATVAISAQQDSDAAQLENAVEVLEGATAPVAEPSEPAPAPVVDSPVIDSLPAESPVVMRPVNAQAAASEMRPAQPEKIVLPQEEDAAQPEEIVLPEDDAVQTQENFPPQVSAQTLPEAKANTELQRRVPLTRALPAVLADRASGALVGAACGDALGVPYEFVSPRITGVPHMLGGGLGPYQPGEWSDDTQLLICVAEIAANGLDLTTEEALNAIAQRYLAWFQGGASDIDSQTRLILESIDAETLGEPLARQFYARKLRRSAVYFHRRTRRAAGNALLPRMAVVGLTRVEDREWTAAAAREVTMLTHVDDLACDASVLWAEAVRRACTDPVIDQNRWIERIHIEDGLDLIPRERRDEWVDWLAQARAEYFAPPGDNTFVVATLQAAVGAITQAQLAVKERFPEAAAVGESEAIGESAAVGEGFADAGENAGTRPRDGRRDENLATRGFVEAINAAVRIGGDTDTVAASVGALMGAACGANAIPQRWTRAIFGWPGMDSKDLRDLGVATALAGIVGERGMQNLLASESGLEKLFEIADAERTDSQKNLRANN